MRRYVRQATQISIAVKADSSAVDVNFSSTMTSLSQGGFSCKLPKEIAIGAVVKIDITSVSPAFSGSGEVVWCQQDGEEFEVGVRFTDKEEAYKARMVQQVCQIEHYKKSVFEQEGRVLTAEQAAAEWIAKFAKSIPPNK